ncbi:MAG: glycosyl transferase, group 1 [Paucimonas sp.]|nr:glycosyl transferase, group 1 [Paucimonas sp.]
MTSRIVISSNTSWSVVNFRARLIRTLLEHGHEVTVLAPRDKHAPRLVHPGCRVIDLEIDVNGTNPARDLALVGRYFKHLRRERPAAYLGYTVKPNVYGSIAAHLLGIPVINNVSGLGRAFIAPGPVTHVVRLLYRVALRRSHTVFFQNAEDRSLFLECGLVPRGRDALLPGSGVDLEHFTPATTTAVPGRGEPDFTFLLIGRMLRDKGVEEFALAARALRGRFPHARFQLLGHIDPGNPGTIPRERIREWEDEHLLEYLGEADDVRPIIARADCVVLPSYREGVPRSLLEAAAMGKPLLASDAVGCRDAVTDRITGLLCKPGNAHDLAMKMSEMICFEPDRRSRMGAAGRRKMETSFDEHIVIARYLEAIGRCSGGRPGQQVANTSLS